MELRLRRYDSIVDIFMYSESLFIGHVFECSTRQQGSSGLYWGKNYLLYFLFLRILLICLKYAKLKCMEADYRRFPVLVTIEYHWELRKKTQSVITKFASFGRHTLSQNLTIFYRQA